MVLKASTTLTSFGIIYAGTICHQWNAGMVSCLVGGEVQEGWGSVIGMNSDCLCEFVAFLMLF